MSCCGSRCVVQAVLVISLFASAGCLDTSESSSTTPRATTPGGSILPGSKVRIYHPRLGQRDVVPIMVDDRAYDEIMQAKDAEVAQELEASGKVFPVTNGTECRIINSYVNSYEIRVLSGPHAGRTGYVQRVFVSE